LTSAMSMQLLQRIGSFSEGQSKITTNSTPEFDPGTFLTQA